MDASEIVRACLERGVIVSSEDIKLIEGGASLEDFLAARMPRQPEAREAPPGRITLRMRRRAPMTELAPAGLIEERRKAYELGRSLLLPKASAISVTNARASAAPVSLIGMAKQSGPSGFMLEDPTGEIGVSCEADMAGVEDDDVVGVRGVVRGGRLECKEVLFPDIPLLRPAGRIDAKLLLVPAPAGQIPEADAVLAAAPIESGARHAVVGAQPSYISICKDGRKVVVLSFRAGCGLQPKDATGLLKRRIVKSRSIGWLFPIDTVPDILWIIGSGQDWTAAYKGVAVVHSSARQALIDLKTMETTLV